MLNNKDLAVTRAALQFLDEEFSAGDEELFQHYLDDRGILGQVDTSHIPLTRAKFDSAEVYLAMKRVGKTELASTSLVRLPSDGEVASSLNHDQPVSVIVTDD